MVVPCFWDGSENSRDGLLDQDFQIGRERLGNFMDDAIFHQRDGETGRTKLGGSNSCPEEANRPRAIILSARPDQTLRVRVRSFAPAKVR